MSVSLKHQFELKLPIQCLNLPWKQLKTLDKNSNKKTRKAHFEVLQTKSSTLPRAVWAGESKPGLGFEIGPQQQKDQRSPNVHLMGNPVVVKRRKRQK